MPSRPARRSQFVLGQLSVAILVQLLEGSRRVGDFLFGKHAVVVCVERFHERIGWMAMAASTRALQRTVLTVARWRTLTISFVVPLRRPLGGLGHNGHRAERTNHADRAEHVT
jgi:hypothetical protein